MAKFATSVQETPELWGHLLCHCALIEKINQRFVYSTLSALPGCVGQHVLYIHKFFQSRKFMQIPVQYIVLSNESYAHHCKYL